MKIEEFVSGLSVNSTEKDETSIFYFFCLLHFSEAVPQNTGEQERCSFCCHDVCKIQQSITFSGKLKSSAVNKGLNVLFSSDILSVFLWLILH